MNIAISILNQLQIYFSEINLGTYSWTKGQQSPSNRNKVENKINRKKRKETDIYWLTVSISTF